MGRGLVQAPLRAVLAAMEDDECHHQYDQNWRDTTEIQSLPPTLLDGRAWRADGAERDAAAAESSLVGLIAPFVAHSRYNRVFPTAPRDSCEVRAQCFDRSTGVVYGMAHSVEHTRCPPATDGHVRLKIICGGYRLAPAANGDSTWLADVTCSDPGGSVPASVVRMVAAQRALNVARIRATPLVRDRARWAPMPAAMAASA